VEASGEVAALKDTLNEMIRNLGETTRQNVEQDWLKTNRERFTRMLQGQDNLAAVSSMILSELANLVSAQHGVFYSITAPTDGGEPMLELQAGYGNEERRQLSTSFRLGEGLVGQCGKEKKRILLTEVPGDYVRINSGLGASPPLSIIVLPVLFEGSLRAVIELASFSPFSEIHQTFLDSITESIGIVLSTIQASAVTETLLRQSQTLAEELRSQQGELQASNEGLERQASLLSDRNREASNRNQEIEQSKRLLEEKAAQLAISSKYKSEFIANMSHELRTPLNSLLILAEQLEDNPDHNMTETQVEYASVISASGKDLMALLNSILDLAKAESGTMAAEMTDLNLGQLTESLIREFEPVAQKKGVRYAVDMAAGVPPTMVTDPQRLRQIMKNLLANAFKFTERGEVRAEIRVADSGWNVETASLVSAPTVIAFSVTDSGIGITDEQQQRIFEAFAQGDGSTARLYGGTGLGLSISRELVGLLGGEITVTSTAGQGSTFTVYLPVDGPGPSPSASRAATAGTAGVSDGYVLPLALLAPPPELNGLIPGQGRLGGTEDNVLEGTKILLVDDDFRNIFALSALLQRGQADVVVAESGAEAVAILERTPDIDIVLMDIMMPIMDGYETMRTIRAIDQFRWLPIIAVTGKVMAGERQRCVDAGANDYVPKPVDTAQLYTALRPWILAKRQSASATLAGLTTTNTASTTLAPSPILSPSTNGAPSLHIVPDGHRSNGTSDSAIEGTKILIVDDDFRNVFALSALLERSHADVFVAESGAEALAALELTPDIDIVLMDIMMPVMDGYETIRSIRAIDNFTALPIVAVTGKVMAGERQRCIEAGANDYVPKPVDTAELLAALRPWLPAVATPTS
jgi:signal transduction histidine kinase/DNA-binding response OmpR family regulator